MGPNTEKLHLMLEETIDLLKHHDVTYWANWLEKEMLRIVKADFQGVEHLLSAFGGMRSLNDLYICKENGHMIEEDQVPSVNDQLKQLTSEIYNLAEEIRKETDL
ncbi:DUF6966 domain-containing protein [Sulfurovum mangrovi]|uniref:DUF6966 domain-containing protein n=1 Tax=Sulfurovum mangrovi TaxID=2893889 RepID=UPI001E4AFFC7|nr:hypothetical protein [Sulfurovum mangrovi]UFH60245.1 hypothetical protein LN246_05200 [Sulfurovum mangrovi]